MPLYVYSRQILRRRFEIFQKAFPKARIHFAMKSNHWKPLLQELKALGSHVDVVSIGEVRAALEAGFKADQVIFSGVGKTQREIHEALDLGVFQINIESADELQKIVHSGKKAQVGLRWTPGLDVKTHPFIKTSHDDTKFGLSDADIFELISEIQKHPQISLQGLSLHLGSQILDLEDFRLAFKAFKDLVKSLPVKIQNVDLGGGLGINYKSQNLEEDEFFLNEYRKVVDEIWETESYNILFEPGRFLVARAGGLITQVQAVKKTKRKKIVVVDAGMTHLIRPVLYDAYHGVYPIVKKMGALESVDVVGPICESADYLALGRELTPLMNGDFVWIADVGAYGSSMSSQYNLRPAFEEIFVEDLKKTH